MARDLEDVSETSLNALLEVTEKTEISRNNWEMT